MVSNKQRAYVLLQTVDDLDEICQEIGIGRSTLIKYKKEFEEAKLRGDLHKLIDLDSAVVAKLSTELNLDEVELTQKLDGLSELNSSMQKAALLTTQKITNMVESVSADDTGKLAVCVDMLCTLQNAFFNKNSVNLNVQNNNFGESEGYGDLLNDKPPINI